MSQPKPYRSAMDAPIEIRATRPDSPEIASWVYPDRIESAKQRMTEQGYAVTSVTDHTK